MSNRLVVVLVALNVTALAIVFWLVGLLVWDDTGEQPQQTMSDAPVQAIAEAEQPAQPTGNESAADTIELASATRAQDQPATVEKTSKFNVYYEGNIVRMEESDDSGNTHLVISNSLDDDSVLPVADADNIIALEQLRTAARSHLSIRKMTRGQAAGKPAAEPAASEAVGYLDREDIGEETAAEEAADQPAFVQQIEAVVAITRNIAPRKENRKYIWPSLNAYVQALDSATGERARDIRTIEVRQGDSLWTLAERAYGSGYEYPRIYKANPHLTNPDMIRAGDILRVPL